MKHDFAFRSCHGRWCDTAKRASDFGIDHLCERCIDAISCGDECTNGLGNEAAVHATGIYRKHKQTNNGKYRRNRKDAKRTTGFKSRNYRRGQFKGNALEQRNKTISRRNSAASIVRARVHDFMKTFARAVKSYKRASRKSVY